MSSSLRLYSHVGYHSIDVEPEVTGKYRLGRVSLLVVGCLVLAFGTVTWWDLITIMPMSAFRVTPVAPSITFTVPRHVTPSNSKQAKPPMATPVYANQRLPVFYPILADAHHMGQTVPLPRPESVVVAGTSETSSPLKTGPPGLPQKSSTANTLLQWMGPALAVGTLFAAMVALRAKAHDLQPKSLKWAMALFGGGNGGGEGQQGGGNPFGNMANLMENLKKTQALVASETQKVQQELAVTEFEGFSDDETVRIVMSGNQVPLSVDITQAAYDQGLDALEGLILEAAKESHMESVQGMKERMKDLAQKLGLPQGPGI